MSYVPDPDWVTRKVADTRERQGLPPVVTDPLVLDQVATLMGPHLEAQQKTKSRPSRAAA